VNLISFKGVCRTESRAPTVSLGLPSYTRGSRYHLLVVGELEVLS